MRALGILALLVPAIAHAGASKSANAVARAGFTKVLLRASSHGTSVFRTEDGDGKVHWVLVDARLRVADLGEVIDFVDDDQYTLAVSRFLGQKDLLDVAVWSRSSLVPANSGTWHAIVRTRPFELACEYQGDGTSATQKSTVTIQKLGDDPLSWEKVAVLDGTPARVGKFVYTLADTGYCHGEVE